MSKFVGLSSSIELNKESIMNEDYGIEVIKDSLMDFISEHGSFNYGMYFEIDGITIGLHDIHNIMGVSFIKDGMDDYQDIKRTALFPDDECHCDDEDNDSCQGYCYTEALAWMVADNVKEAFEVAISRQYN